MQKPSIADPGGREWPEGQESILRNMKKKRIISVVLKSLLILTIFATLVVGVYFVLRACGFATKEDFVRLRDSLGDTIWIWFIIGALQIVQVIFIPISNQVITVPCALVFNDQLLWVWITSWISIWIATLILYALGRWGGEKVLKWLLKDKEQASRCTKFINRGWMFYPLGMLLPLPDDIVTVLAGTGRMKFWFVALCSLFTRGIDTAASVWGWGCLTRFWWGWIVLAAGIIALGILTAAFWRWQKHKERIEESQDATESYERNERQ